MEVPIVGKAIADTVAEVFRGEPDVARDPYPLFARVREHAPLLRAPAIGPFPAVHLARYEDVHSALRDGRLSSERPHGGAVPDLEDDATPEDREAQAVNLRVGTLSMLTKDPPDHTRLRKPVTKAFTPRIVGQQEPMVQALVDDLLAGAKREAEREGGVDFMRAVAVPLPALVIAVLLGVPQEDWEKFKAWSDNAITFDPEAGRRGLHNSLRLDRYLRDLISQRRAEPRDDLITALVRARDEDDALTEDELIAQCTVILVGGHETTTVALGSALALLKKQPELWEAMRAQPELVPAVVEECVRLESPFQFNTRVAKEDLEIGGEAVRAGETVWMWVAAANRDPRRFPDPDIIDPHRADGTHLAHLAFGGGVHYCLGAALARLEMRIALATLAQRYPDFRMLDDRVRWRDNIALRGPSALRVRFGHEAHT
jgi:cytochrome P450